MTSFLKYNRKGGPVGFVSILEEKDIPLDQHCILATKPNDQNRMRKIVAAIINLTNTESSLLTIYNTGKDWRLCVFTPPSYWQGRAAFLYGFLMGRRI